MAAPRGRYVLVGGVLLVGGLLAAVGSSGGTAAGASSDAAPAEKGGGGVSFGFGGGGGETRVEVTAPRRGPIAATIQAPGTVQAGSEAGIGAAFEGKVFELCKDTGDAVAEGEVVFRLDPRDHDEKVREAEIDLLRKQAALEEARADLLEAERKAKEAANEPSEVTEARLKVRQDELEVQRARAQLEAAQGRLDRARRMLEDNVGRRMDVESAETESRVSAITVRVSEEQLGLSRESLEFRTRGWEQARAEAEKVLAVSRTREQRAKADLQAAELALERARRDLERTYIRSPLDGVITSRGVNQGDLVARIAGNTAHYIISDLSRLLVYVDVDEGDVTHVRRGQPARVSVNALGEDLRLEGAVYSVGYRAEQKQGEEVKTFLVRVLLNPEQDGHARLRPGMSATAEIATARAADALKVPLMALVQRERKELPDDVFDQLPAALREALPASVREAKPRDLIDCVFVARDGKAQVRPVVLGVQDQDEVEVTAGLEPDAQVVLGPFRALEKLAHGDGVRPEQAQGVVLGEEEDWATREASRVAADAAPVDTAARGE